MNDIAKMNTFMVKILKSTLKLNIPDNIILIFQPPYSPEVNVAEKI